MNVLEYKRYLSYTFQVKLSKVIAYSKADISAVKTTLPKTLNVSNVFLVGAAALLLFARLSFTGFQSQDYLVFLKEWFNHFKDVGFNFTENFSNYNFPYLYLLWFGGLFTNDALVVVKAISIVADVSLAFAVVFLLKHYVHKYWAYFAGAIVFLLPEVLINSSMWGQADAIFVGFLMWSLGFFVRSKHTLGWLFFFVALSFKIQAIFILPVLAFWFLYKKQSFKTLVPGVLFFISTYIPALLAGRPFDQLLYAYTSQLGGSTGDFVLITANIPNVSVFFNSMLFDYNFKTVMTLTTLAVVFLILSLLFKYVDIFVKTKFAFLKLVTVFALLLPFLLPNMLDRYYYLANVLLIVLAFVDWRFIFSAVLSQVITVTTYAAHLSLTAAVEGEFPMIPLIVLTVVQMFNIGLVCWLVFGGTIKEIYKKNVLVAESA